MSQLSQKNTHADSLPPHREVVINLPAAVGSMQVFPRGSLGHCFRLLLAGFVAQPVGQVQRAIGQHEDLAHLAVYRFHSNALIEPSRLLIVIIEQ